MTSDPEPPGSGVQHFQNMLNKAELTRSRPHALGMVWHICDQPVVHAVPRVAPRMARIDERITERNQATERTFAHLRLLALRSLYDNQSR
ncbi:hypothetical protein Y032_0005g2582 [Ancylostoma ceylanicum]|uniref:Uncharacterized protein n=1 Tax=Ancylostoma ceylanicum TaxID=53326 RepID=A0A016VSM6_9BILA|nr:hypothetical protein Y032_0005g2582 [Ancylostoma ceylanicum]